MGGKDLTLARDFLVVGYETFWDGDVDDIRFDRITHINYAFLLPADSGDGSLQPLQNEEKLRWLVKAAHARGVKVLISVGGWNDGNDEGFELLAAAESSTENFVVNIVDFVEEYELDGADIDWEYPDAGESAQLPRRPPNTQAGKMMSGVIAPA